MTGELTVRLTRAGAYALLGLALEVELLDGDVRDAERAILGALVDAEREPELPIEAAKPKRGRPRKPRQEKLPDPFASPAAAKARGLVEGSEEGSDS